MSQPFPRLPTLSLPPQFASPPPRTSPQARAAASQARLTQPRTGVAAFAHTPFASPPPRAAAPAPSPSQSPAASSAVLRCDACDSDNMGENALGYWICRDCGMQSQERMALTQEMEDGAYQNMGQMWRTGTRIKTRKRVRHKVTPEEEEIILSQVLLHGFQCLLQLQCRTLVVQFGVPPQLASVVGRLWLSYVQQWHDVGGWGRTHRDMLVRRFVQGSTKASANRRRGGKAAGDTPAEPVDDGRLRDNAEVSLSLNPEESDELFPDTQLVAGEAYSDDIVMQDAPDALEYVGGADAAADAAAAAATPSAAAPPSSSSLERELAPGELSLSLSLALLYLGCHLLRESITMHQLVVWVSLGRLPYFSPKGLPQALVDRIHKSATLKTFFHPQYCPTARVILVLAHRTAARIATGWEGQAQRQFAQTQRLTDDMEIILQQAQQLRELLAVPVGHASYGEEGAAGTPATTTMTLMSSSSVNSSLLLRTWLAQLRFPPQLHPIILELVAQLAVNTDQLNAANALGHKKRKDAKSVTGEAVTDIQKATSQQQTNLMACLILALQLTYGSRSGSSAAAGKESSQLDTSGSSLDSSLVQRGQPAAAAGAADGRVPSAASAETVNPVAATLRAHLLSASAADAPPSSIAENWATDVRWPHNVHEARTLPPHQQRPFVSWMSSVVLSRFAPPKDFDLYLDMLQQIEQQQRPVNSPEPPATGRHTGTRREGEEEEEEEEEGEEAARTHAAAAAAAASTGADSRSISSMLSQLVSCELVSYIPTRRGFYHLAYASLLDRCAQLIGVHVPRLHAAVQAILRLAQDKQIEEYEAARKAAATVAAVAQEETEDTSEQPQSAHVHKRRKRAHRA